MTFSIGDFDVLECADVVEPLEGFADEVERPRDVEGAVGTDGMGGALETLVEIVAGLCGGEMDAMAITDGGHGAWRRMDGDDEDILGLKRGVVAREHGVDIFVGAAIDEEGFGKGIFFCGVDEGFDAVDVVSAVEDDLMDAVSLCAWRGASPHASDPLGMGNEVWELFLDAWDGLILLRAQEGEEGDGGVIALEVGHIFGAVHFEGT